MGTFMNPEKKTGCEMYLFDTDIITNILKKRPSKNLVKKLSQLNRDLQFISTITIAEIVYGAMRSERPSYHINNLVNLIIPSVNILTFDSPSAFIYGEIRADLEIKGKILNHTDMQIASIAITNDLTLITGNTKHFSRIDRLQLENWL